MSTLPPSLYESISPAMRARIQERVRSRRYAVGQLIQSQGDTTAGLSIVGEGAVKLYRLSPEGDVTLTGVLGPGFCFGDATLFDTRPRMFNIEAIEPTRIDLLGVDDFNALMATEPTFAHAMLKMTVLKMLFAFEQLDAIRSRSLLARTGQALSLMWRAQGMPEALALSQADVAALLGVSRVSANRVLKQLQQRGLIAPGYRQIRLLRPEQLASLQ